MRPFRSTSRAVLAALTMAATAHATPDDAPALDSTRAPGGDSDRASAPAAARAATEDSAPAGSSKVPSTANAPEGKDKQPEPGEVTVVGTRVSKTAGSSHILGNKQLERFEYDDPHQVLAAVPGVYSRGEDGLGLRPNIGLRGVNPDRSKKVALLEDGIPFAPAPYSASAAYFFPLMTRMVQVRVLKGPASISYGPQTVGGAIDLVTRPVPTGTAAAVDLATGMYGYGKLHGHFGSSTERTGFLVEALHLRNDGFKELPSGADTGFYRNEAMFKGFYRFDPDRATKHEVSLKLTYSDEVSNETYLGLTDDDFRRNPLRRYPASALDRMRWHRTGVAATHVIEPIRDWTITTTVYRNDLSRVWRKVNGFRGASVFDVLTNQGEARYDVFRALLRGEGDGASPAETLLVGPNERDFVSQGIESRMRWNGSTGPLAHRAEYGVRLHEDRIERRHSEMGFLLQAGQLVPEGTATVTTTFNEAQTHALSMHVIDAVTWRSLTLTPGARIEAFRSKFVDRAAQSQASQLSQVLLPGLGAYYGLTDDFGVLAGVYRGFSPPAPASASPNAAKVSPELSVNYEGGVRFARGHARAEVIGFYNDYSNLTDVCTLSSGCVNANLDRQFDAGQARIFGVEAYAEHEIKLGQVKFPLNAAYTFTRAEFATSFRSEDPIFGFVREGDEVPYVPRHQANGSAGVDIGRASAAVNVTYVAAMREAAGRDPIEQVLHTDEQVVVDLSGSLRVFGPVSLYVNARNLADGRFIVSRRPYGARPNAPRWVQVGLKASF